MVLFQRGDQVSGVEQVYDNTSGNLKGTYSNNTLSLERDVFPQNQLGEKTFQFISLIGNGEELKGYIWNQGVNTQKGTINIKRKKSFE